MNLNKLMKQAQKMQEQMAKTQAELEKKTVEVSAAGGKVRVTANGAGDVIAIKIDKEVVDPNDVEFLEEIVLGGVKQAVEQGKALGQSEMTKITGRLQLQLGSITVALVDEKLTRRARIVPLPNRTYFAGMFGVNTKFA